MIMSTMRTTTASSMTAVYRVIASQRRGASGDGFFVGVGEAEETRLELAFAEPFPTDLSCIS